MAAAAARVGAPILHVSTDYVFDGTKAEPYVEDDPVGPTSVYGRSKLEGEQAVAAANPRHVILRTAWVYAPFGANFVRTMLRLAAERDSLRVVDDQIGCPTYAPDIADAVLAIAKRIGAGGWRDEYAGVTHLAGPDAGHLVRLRPPDRRRRRRRGAAARFPSRRSPRPIFPTPATRPANSRLSTGRLADTFGIVLPPLPTSLGRCLDRLIGPAR